MTTSDEPGSYGERWAEVYDDEHAFLDPSDAVAFLSELAGGRPVLELGIGTGRVALPLHAAGVDIRGVDASPAMVERLRAKVGGDRIDVARGDMASMPLGGPYGLVFLVFNTLFALLTQQRQLDCFSNVASALMADGCFVIECFVPDVARFRDGGQTVRVFSVDDRRLRLHASMHDAAAQQVKTQVALIGDNRIETRPLAIRYAWPSEIDLMAKLAGLELAQRWADWDKTPFTARAEKHVSVFRKPVA